MNTAQRIALATLRSLLFGDRRVYLQDTDAAEERARTLLLRQTGCFEHLGTWEGRRAAWELSPEQAADFIVHGALPGPDWCSPPME